MMGTEYATAELSSLSEEFEKKLATVMTVLQVVQVRTAHNTVHHKYAAGSDFFARQC